jgi:hypothetical protein
MKNKMIFKNIEKLIYINNYKFTKICNINDMIKIMFFILIKKTLPHIPIAKY